MRAIAALAVSTLLVANLGAPTRAAARARDVPVTSESAKAENLLEYVRGRTDLSREQKEEWVRAIRLAFGGTALRDGHDEGVTVAKSVISAAIFHEVSPKKAARAAYDAYHDTARWVPPPIAINYQVLAFRGRKPAVSARQLAYDFPRYFSEDLAVELVLWWNEMLERGKIPKLEVRAVREALASTRKKMRPMLLERLFWGAELQSRVGAGHQEVEIDEELRQLEQEIARDFRGVASSSAVYRRGLDMYERYTALCEELGLPAKPRPARRVLRKGPQDSPPARPAPQAPLEPPKTPPQEALPDDMTRPRPTAETEKNEGRPGTDTKTRARPGDWRTPGNIPAPLPGDPLIGTYTGWTARLMAAVKQWSGTPYRLGGTNARGIDCSAFVRAVLRQVLDVELPRNSRAQHRTGSRINAQKDLRAGDLIFFDTLDRGRITHVGVYLGDGLFAHASSSKGVTRAVFKKRYYQRAFRSSKRIID